jgi:hypothetical protein
MAMPSVAICSLDAGEPGGVKAAFVEQLVAAAHGALEIAGAAAVGWIERQDQPIEKAAALGRAAGEQAVHRRRQPEQAQMIGSSSAVFAGVPLMRRRRVWPRRRVVPGADLDLALHAVERREDRKATMGADPGDVAIGGAAQAAPGDRKETASIRLVLPAPLSPVSTTCRPSSSERLSRVVAKIGELEAGKGDLVRHGLSGFVRAES